MTDDHASAEEKITGPFLTQFTAGRFERIIVLPMGTSGIGRYERECNIVLNAPWIGRRNAKIERTETETYIQDLGHQIGVFVNGESLPRFGRRRLRSGDEIQIAIYRFIYSEPS